MYEQAMALVAVLVLGGGIALLLKKKDSDNDKAAQLICRDCGTLGNTRAVVKGHFAIELALWIFFIIPGLIYTIWRLTNKDNICASCGSANLIPVDSPMGAKLLQELGNTGQSLLQYLRIRPSFETKKP